MVRKLTTKQRKFVQGYLATGNASLAAKNSYDVKSDATARVIGSENLTKPNIQATILEALDAQGLTNEHLATKVAELVNAQRKVTVVRSGELEAVEERIDTQAVKAGLEFAFKLKEPALKREAGFTRFEGVSTEALMERAAKLIAEMDPVIREKYGILPAKAVILPQRVEIHQSRRITEDEKEA
jgi:phage terminase small subunit